VKIDGSWASVGESAESGKCDSKLYKHNNTLTTPSSDHAFGIVSEDELYGLPLAKAVYGDRVTPTSYLSNRCMTCGRVPVGKNFELLYDGYAEIVIKMCHQCYIRFYYVHENSSSDRWTVIT